MAGETLSEQGVVADPVPSHVSVKESVFPFVKFAGVDIALGPEMRSTGEVMGVSGNFSLAFCKGPTRSGDSSARNRKDLFKCRKSVSKKSMVDLARRLVGLGFELIATSGTAEALSQAGVQVESVKKLQEGHPNLIDHLIDGRVQLIFNTPRGKGARTDEGRIRRKRALRSPLYNHSCGR